MDQAAALMEFEDAHGPVYGTVTEDAVLMGGLLQSDNAVSKFVSQCVGLCRYAEEKWATWCPGEPFIAANIFFGPSNDGMAFIFKDFRRSYCMDSMYGEGEANLLHNAYT